MMQKNCSNCDTMLEIGQNFCSNCGQKTALHRITLSDFLHEIVHAFTHADKGIFHLIRSLTINPGQVLRDFIIDFKRKKYFNPFTFLLIVTGIAVIVTLYFKPYSRNTKTDVQIEQEGKAKNLKPIEIEVAKRNMHMNEFLEKNTKLILFASIPVSAFIFLLFYRKTGINFSEHLVACIFITGYLSLIMTVFTPIMAAARNGKEIFLITGATLIFQLIYFAQAYYGFMKHYKHTKLRAYMASLTNIITWTIVSVAVISIYFFKGLTK